MSFTLRWPIVRFGIITGQSLILGHLVREYGMKVGGIAAFAMLFAYLQGRGDMQR